MINKVVKNIKYPAPKYTKGQHACGKVKNSYGCGGKVKKK